MDYHIDIISTVTCKKERKNMIVVNTFLNNVPYVYLILVQCYFSEQLWREEEEKNFTLLELLIKLYIYPYYLGIHTLGQTKYTLCNFMNLHRNLLLLKTTFISIYQAKKILKEK